MDYKKIHDIIINKASWRILQENQYYEIHHIVPRCMGGSDDNENLVKLLPEEHLIIHLLLVKMFPENTKLIYAANMMKNLSKNNKTYGWLRRKFSKACSNDFIGKKRTKESIEKQKNTIKKMYENGYVSPRLGSTLSDEHKSIIRESNKGKIIKEKSKSNLAGFIIRYGDDLGLELYEKTNLKKDSSSLSYFISRYGEEVGKEKYNERCKNISETMNGENNPFYGKSHSNETREKISKSKKGKPVFRSLEHNKKIGDAHRGKPHEKIECPHCGKVGGKSTMKRWHFDNCKKK